MNVSTDLLYKIIMQPYSYFRNNGENTMKTTETKQLF